MVGGIVIDVAIVNDSKIYVDCRDRTYRDTCAIHLENDEVSRRIEIGDSLWWQGGYAYWTPATEREREGGKSGVDYDIKIRRIGFSGVRSPTAAKEGE